MSAGTETVASQPPAGTLPLETARWRLAMVWFPSCGLIFLIMIAQSIGGAYGSELGRAWGWVLPTFLPTLALMISVFAADALSPPATGAGGPVVRRAFARLATALSVFYILAILVALLAQPIYGSYVGGADPTSARLDLLETSNLWLAPLQSLVVAAIGVLFFLKESAPGRKAPAKETA
jgi:hypothetical protein